jgi:hypothetical protein
MGDKILFANDSLTNYNNQKKIDTVERIQK